MNPRQIFVWLFALCAVGYCQQTGSPAQVRLKIVPVNQNIELNERLMVKAEFQNTTKNTLCFPVPDRKCTTPQTGWLLVTGEPVAKTKDSDQFVCHVDAQGAVGTELDDQVKRRWIKIPANGVYVTDPAPALVTLNVAGIWRVSATYHPPEGSFSPSKYRATLKEAAAKADCVLPDSDVLAEPINVIVAAGTPHRDK